MTSNPGPRGHERSEPVMKRYHINETWDITRIANNNTYQYILVNKAMTAEDVMINGMTAKQVITDPLTIELFDQLIQARAWAEDVASSIQPYIQKQKEQALTELIKGDDNDVPDTIEFARR